MGGAKLTFKRYEKKYLLSAGQYAALRLRLDEYIEPDTFFSSTVCSIYYDSEDFTLIRQSIEKPVYKEKLRVRSYNVPAPDGKVFIELKKKYKGIVYKRRVQMQALQAQDYLAGKIPAPEDSQIFHELDWFMKTNDIAPRAFIACDREAYVAKENPELRITFDRAIRWRENDLSLPDGDHGEPLLEDGEVLMEIKIPGAAPMWLAHMLCDLDIFPTSFSKYGTCYKKALLEKYFNGVITCV